ncbi:SusC/RagA family TonB-linked outer membrane protein [Desertivirga xinjiangensis]|uniref:SusC/RagA family TonB-linked outer membrane protein n=1 Tax=Desertivirga xinjiangensis TaxID=539206 RepID=UPI00210C5843|nr:TonB-dependent receptor [Pedobacter xinjiangensis]
MKCSLQSSDFKKIMMMTFMQMVMFAVLTGVSLAANVKAQGVLDRTVNLSVENVNLDEALRKLESSTDVKFIYSKDFVRLDEKVSLNAKGIKLGTVLKNLLLPHAISFEPISDRIILTRSKREEESPENIVPAEETKIQDIVITGVVKSTSGETLPGVSIRVKNKPIATLSDIDGKYTIKVPSANDVLVFSYIGFVTQEKSAGSNRVLNITLADDAQNLKEVVVTVGYGTQKKSTLTGAISTISSKEILKSPNGNVTNSLIGRAPGVGAVQRSGQPGSNSAIINIRGVATYNNTGAIVIVDGVERPDFGDIDPNEIESINILKDASSTAVYGIRGANGVIVVTTKSGKESKPRVSYSGNLSLQSYTGIPKALDAYSNAYLINEANRNDGLSPTWTDAALQKFKDGSDPIGYPNVNWFDYVTRDFYSQTQHNVNVSGGTKVIKYFASVGYLFEDGIFKNFDSPYKIKSTPDYNRYNFRSNIDVKLSKNLDVGVKLGGRLQKRYQPSGLRSGSGSFSYDNVEAMISRVLQVPAFAYPVTLPDGRIAQNPSVGTNIWNPLAVITRWGTRYDDFNSVQSTFNINYKLDALTKGLSFKTVYAYDSYFESTTRRNASWAAYSIDRETKEVTLTGDRPRDEPLSGLENVFGGTIHSNLQTGFNYDRSFGKHSLTGLALFTRQLINVQGGSATTAPPKASQGVVSRLTYNYAGRYFAEFNAAYNGSENFPSGMKYGFFPAVSAGWTISNESFLKNSEWLSYLKVRGSYGLVGSDDIGQRFLYLTNYSRVTGNLNISTPAYSRPGRVVQFGDPNSIRNLPVVYLPDNAIGNPVITWETGTKRNFGIESKFFRDAISLNLEFFDETRKDILTPRQSGMQILGQGYPPLNIGEVYNKGFEAELDLNKRSGDLSYGLNTQVSFARNRIISRDEPIGRPDYQKQEGKRVGQFFGYLTNGFYQSQEDIDSYVPNELGNPIPGDLKYVDYNRDGRINSDDRAPIGYSRTPEYIFSFTPRMAYKGVSLSLMFQGVANVSSDVILSEQNNGQQMYEFMLNRWTPETAATATWPALHSRGNPYISYQLNDFILQDASYIKLRNAELSWSLPARWLSPLKISSLRVFLTGQNLITWTKFKMYLDPENINLSNTDFSKQSIYPTSRIYNLGVNLQL